MTYELGLCGVCHINPAIGVASTSIPFSCAYCRECAERGADPEWVCEYLLNEVAGGDASKLREGLVTFSDGKYISFHDWAKRFIRHRTFAGHWIALPRKSFYWSVMVIRTLCPVGFACGAFAAVTFAYSGHELAAFINTMLCGINGCAAVSAYRNYRL